MIPIQFIPLPSDQVAFLRAGGLDAHGQPPERQISDGDGNPCRHCLDFIPKGRGMLVLAHRPFAQAQPYAETGPIFLCADDCAPWAGTGLPPILTGSPDFLIKGYYANERIAYGTGQVTPRDGVMAYAAGLLARDDIAFVDVRSARNNCFQVRIIRSKG